MRIASSAHSQENAITNPPPPGGAPEFEPLVNVMIVPAATLLEAVTEFTLPAVAVVENVMMVLPGVQTFELLDGVTVSRIHVVAAPVYDQIVMLGLHAAGATTVTIPFKVTCCRPPPGRIHAAVPVLPPTV